jgi:hypothetical protein
MEGLPPRCAWQEYGPLWEKFPREKESVLSRLSSFCLTGKKSSGSTKAHGVAVHPTGNRALTPSPPVQCHLPSSPVESARMYFLPSLRICFPDGVIR